MKTRICDYCHTRIAKDETIAVFRHWIFHTECKIKFMNLVSRVQKTVTDFLANNND